MMKELRMIFVDFDKNGDGQLSSDEIKQGLKSFFNDERIAEIELNKLISDMDSDKNHIIEYEEFLRVTANLDQLITDKNLNIAFDFYDKDKNGKLSNQ